MRISFVSTSTRSPGCAIRPVFRLANGPWPISQFPSCSPQHGRLWWLVQRPAPLRSTRMRPTIEVEAIHSSLRSSTTSLSLPQRGYCWRSARNTLGQFRRPRRLAHLAWPMRVLFQGRQIVAVEAPLPAIESLPADAKVPASPHPIPAIEKIKQHPLKPCLGCPA